MIEFRNVSKSFGDRLLIDDLNITIPPGAVVDSRMPTPAERDRWAMPPGVPVLVVGGEVYPRHRYVLRAAADHPDG